MDTEDSQTISELKNEIAALKEQIKLSKEQETQSQQTLNKIKQIHKEFETSYLTAISEYKTIEENLKKQYFSYQSILENQFNQSEKRLNERMFNQRNKKMKKEILNFLENDKQVFVVVGVGHLILENNLLEMLSENGLKIQRY
jgi:uncharacterized protein YbaP (TraB family)